MSLIKDVAALKEAVSTDTETKLAKMQAQIDHMAALLEKELDYKALPKRHREAAK